LLAIATQPIVPLEAIDGIGPTYARKLAAAGITSTSALLARCDSESAVARLSRQAGIAEGLIAGWVKSADLTRIDGVGTDHMELLNTAGIGSVEQLTEIDPRELHGMLAATNAENETVASVPGAATLRDWKGQATALVG
jgi:predicted flap endonuclease-1-like 5' DNA nuclease